MSALVFSLLCFFIILGLHTSDVAASNLVCYKGSLNNFTSTPIENPAGILDCIDKTKRVRIFTHGFNATQNGPAITTVINAFLQVEGNALLLDWIKESQATTLLEYPAVVLRSMKVAADFANALIFLIQNGVPISLIYLVGHSVGAHVMGEAAEDTRDRGFTLPWISGLDPAGPFFEFPLGFKGISASQAMYVQILHTNPNNYGTGRSVGDADFWANCGNDGVQPACDTGAFGPLNDDDFCSHNFAFRIYAEALVSPDGFPASQATSCSNWKSQTTATVINYYGENADESEKFDGIQEATQRKSNVIWAIFTTLAKRSRNGKSKTGDFYFSTNPTPPYSKGQDGALSQ